MLKPEAICLCFCYYSIMKKVRTIIRFEGLLLLFVAITLYFHNRFLLSWFVLLLFLPDIFMIGYAKNNKTGALIYNIGHSLVLPYALLIIATIANSRAALLLSLVWLAHIGMDRFLGYGLKLDGGFKHTHLGDIGKDKSNS